MDKTLVVKLRKEKGWTQETLAERAYVTVRTIQRLEAGQEVSEGTLKSVSNALSVTVNELFDYVDTAEREERLMEISKEQAIQLNKRRSEETTIKLILVGVVFLIMSLLGVYVGHLHGEWQSIMGIIWIFLLFISIGTAYYFVKVIMVTSLDRRYPLTAGIVQHQSNEKKVEENQPITNVWEFIARFWWLIFPIGGFLSWLIPSIVHAFR